jgi:hypothetical protein
VIQYPPGVFEAAQAARAGRFTPASLAAGGRQVVPGAQSFTPEAFALLRAGLAPVRSHGGFAPLPTSWADGKPYSGPPRFGVAGVSRGAAPPAHLTGGSLGVPFGALGGAGSGLPSSYGSQLLAGAAGGRPGPHGVPGGVPSWLAQVQELSARILAGQGG